MIDQFHQHYENSLSNGAPTWLKNLRESAMDNFSTLGYPDSKDEAWKYTSTKPLKETSFQLSEDYEPKHLNYDQLQCMRIGRWRGLRLTFVNGHFAQEHSHLEDIPSGVTVLPLKEALQKHPDLVKNYLGQQTSSSKNPFVALNTAFIQDGAFVHIAKGTVLEEPLELHFASFSDEAAIVSHPRNLVIAEPGSQATIIESYSGKRSPNPYFSNVVTEVVTQPGAIIHHYKVQGENESAYHLSFLGVYQGRGSSFASYNISLGSSLARNELRSLLAEEGAECRFNGLYMAHGKQHVDNQTFIDHLVPQCTSNELYKGILDDQSHGVFNGQIFVRQGAQKTYSNLTNNNLLLSKEAVVDTKPLLEIFANDVKCSHGATIGRLDETQIFYLRSRGIDPTLARHLLTYAFASEVLHEMKVSTLKAHLEEVLLNRLKIAELSVEGERNS